MQTTEVVLDIKGKPCPNFSLRGIEGLLSIWWAVELSKNMVRDPVSVLDFFATVCVALQIDTTKYLCVGDRLILNANNGKPNKLFFF